MPTRPGPARPEPSRGQHKTGQSPSRRAGGCGHAGDSSLAGDRDRPRKSSVSFSQWAREGGPRPGQRRKEQTVLSSLAGLQFNGRKRFPEHRIAHKRTRCPCEGVSSPSACRPPGLAGISDHTTWTTKKNEFLPVGAGAPHRPPLGDLGRPWVPVQPRVLAHSPLEPVLPQGLSFCGSRRNRSQLRVRVGFYQTHLLYPLPRRKRKETCQRLWLCCVRSRMRPSGSWFPDDRGRQV